MTRPIARRPLLASAAALLVLATAAQVQAQAQAPATGYPAKPITLVVPFPAGGPADVVARALGDAIAASLKQPVVIENRSGATGNIGAQAVARAPADGHTLLLTLDTSLTANPVLYGQRMGLDVDRDLQPVSVVGRFDQMLVVHPGTGIKDFRQFAAAAQKGLNYASAGNASPGT